MGTSAAPGQCSDERVAIGPQGLDGRLTVPACPRGYVIVGQSDGPAVPGFVARQLAGATLGTLVVDLNSPEQAPRSAPDCDEEVLAVRFLLATRWLRVERGVAARRIGYWGEGVGAAAALLAAIDAPAIAAVVSLDGRFDSPLQHLTRVRVPTLLLLVAADAATIESNRRAAQVLRGPHELVSIEDPRPSMVDLGPLDLIAAEANAWFTRYLRPGLEGEIST